MKFISGNTFLKLVILHSLILCAIVARAGDPPAANHAIDSLMDVVKHHPNDSIGAKTYIALAGEVLYDNPAQAERYCTASLAMSTAIQWNSGIGEALGWLAYLMEQRGQIDSALIYYQQSLELTRVVHDRKGEAAVLNNIAAIYKDKGMISEALDLYQQSLAIKREVNDPKGTSATYNNIGLIYQNQGQIDEALKYYNLSLHLDDSVGNKSGVATSYLNISSVYRDQGQYDEAMNSVQQSLAISNELGDKYSEGYAHVLIGNIYMAQGSNQEALEQYRISYEIRKSIDDKQGMAYSLKYIGTIYEREDSLAQAKNCYTQSLSLFAGQEDQWGMAAMQYLIGHLYFLEGQLDSAKIMGNLSLQNARDLGYPANIRDAAGLLSDIFRKENNWEAALEMNDLFVRMRDSVQNNETRKIAMRNKFQAEFEKESALFKAQADARVKEQQLQRNAFIGGFILVLLLAGVLYNRYKIKTAANIELGKKNAIISNEKERSDKLLLNILPLYVANELKETGSAKAQNYDSVTVMFTDFKDFTKIAEQLTPEALVREINFCFSEFDRIIGHYKIEKVKTIGDAYMCAGGIPLGYTGHPSEVLNAALDIRDFMLKLKQQKEAQGENCFQIRIGIASGPVVAGVVGLKKFAYDIWGDTVNVAARMESNGEVGKVNISHSTYEMVHNEFACEYRGEIEAKNKGKIKMYFAERLN